MNLSQPQITTLIIEPNHRLIAPYLHLPQNYLITRVDSIQHGFECLLDHKFNLICLSCSFSPMELTDFLIELKELSHPQLIPLILIIDLNKRLNFVPGTGWAGKLSILHSLSSRIETDASLKRLMADL